MKLITHLEAIASINALPVRLLTPGFEPPVRRRIHLKELDGVVVRGELKFVGHMLGWTPLVVIALLERHTAELFVTLVPWHFINALHIGWRPCPRWQNLWKRVCNIEHKITPCWLIRQGRFRTVCTARHSALCSSHWRNLNMARLRKLQHEICEKYSNIQKFISARKTHVFATMHPETMQQAVQPGQQDCFIAAQRCLH